MTAEQEAPTPPVTRSGYVALVGLPNAGKSTLMNQLIGEKLSIVTSKAQTTWQRITGILTEDDAQYIFLDTPGLLQVKDRFQASMLSAAQDALLEADAVLVVIDAGRFKERRDGEMLKKTLAGVTVPLLVAVNKVDQTKSIKVDGVCQWVEGNLDARIFPISALNGSGTSDLMAALRESIPQGPFYYPEDEIASEPVRFFVAEIVRETVFERFEQEIPYSVAAQVEAFREEEDPVYIQVTLYVDQPSQKGILIGQGGRAMKELGKAAREKIEALLQRRVYLELWVKVLPGWRKTARHLRRLGYRVPDRDPREP